MAKVEGKQVELGMILGFKSDHEQYGEVCRIQGRTITVKPTGDRCFRGDYIGGQDKYSADQEDFWI
jgi:hypothetical protein